jgi:hypothetical protein
MIVRGRTGRRNLAAGLFRLFRIGLIQIWFGELPCFGKPLYKRTRAAQLSGATRYRSSTFGGASTLRQAQTTTAVQSAIDTAPKNLARAEGCPDAGVSATSAAR